METFTEAGPLAYDPSYKEKREQVLRKLSLADIDTPIMDIIEGFSGLTYCFTIQSCYGHFVHKNQVNPKNVEPLSHYDEDTLIEYRIAYIALCIENSELGKTLIYDLRALTKIDPDYIQFGSADWFRRQYVNSFAIQVEPERYKDKDSAFVTVDEALHLETIRHRFFKEIRNVIQKHHHLTEERKHNVRKS